MTVGSIVELTVPGTGGVHVFDGNHAPASADPEWADIQPRQLPLRVTADRVLIRADREAQTPDQRQSGLYTAKTMASAVEGHDEEDSWFVGTIVQIGPLVRRFEARPAILRMIGALEEEGHDIAPAELWALRQRIEELPVETSDPLQVGDRVCFSWAAGQQITLDGERYLVLRANEVLAVLEDA